MAFPGGRHDPDDPDLLHTAIRETKEEVGLDLGELGRLIGRLDDLPAIARGRRAGITIAPFVFALSGDPTLCPNYEVEEALWVPLASLASGDRATTVRYRMDDAELELPGWDVGGRVVWGLTYRMLGALFERLTAATGSRQPGDRTPG
jgi:8-oxo-dGTP pyrophosphatase MutT (NUDIX family)